MKKNYTTSDDLFQILFVFFSAILILPQRAQRTQRKIVDCRGLMKRLCHNPKKGSNVDLGEYKIRPYKAFPGGRRGSAGISCSPPIMTQSLNQTPTIEFILPKWVIFAASKNKIRIAEVSFFPGITFEVKGLFLLYSWQEPNKYLLVQVSLSLPGIEKLVLFQNQIY